MAESFNYHNSEVNESIEISKSSNVEDYLLKNFGINYVFADDAKFVCLIHHKFEKTITDPHTFNRYHYNCELLLNKKTHYMSLKSLSNDL